MHETSPSSDIFFFENAARNALNVHGQRCRKMLTEFLWLKLDHFDVQDLSFQQKVRPATQLAKQ